MKARRKLQHNVLVTEVNMTNTAIFFLQIFSTVRSFLKTRAQLFNTNDVVSQCIIKIFIIKYGIYTNIFAEKM